jgi:uncharacterized membrane protein
MTSQVTADIEIDAPVRVAYDQWTQFEELPEFMHNVNSVRQIDEETTHWVADIGGVTREFDARITDQVPDDHIAWESIGERLLAGRVEFQPIDGDRTRVTLNMEWEPETFTEKAGAALQLDDLAVQQDLRRFKKLIEDQGMATGGWRGEVHDGTATDASTGMGTTDMPGTTSTTGTGMGATGTTDTGMGSTGAMRVDPDTGMPAQDI